MKRIKQMFRRHWNCLPWFMCGANAIIKCEVSVPEYILAVTALIMVIWLKLPWEGKE